MDKTWSNQPAAGNAGIPLQFAIEHYWPGVPEPERSPKSTRSHCSLSSGILQP